MVAKCVCVCVSVYHILFFFPIEITAYLGENCVTREKDHNAIGKTSSQANFEVSFV